MKTKLCKKCGVEKPLSEMLVRRCRCKQCNNMMRRKNYSERNCLRCGLVFKPIKKHKRYCSRSCSRAACERIRRSKFSGKQKANEKQLKRVWDEKQREQISDIYIKIHVMRMKSNDFVPNEFLELKRVYIKGKRLIKQLL